MRFDLDDNQRAIRDAAAEMCRRYEAPGAPGLHEPDQLWSEMAASGWAGLCVPQRFGGQGLGMVELSLVVEALGRALAGAAYVGNAAAALAVDGAAAEEERERWLPGMASGERRGAVGTLHGDGAIALDAGGAAVLVVPAADGVRVVDPVPHLTPSASLDLTRTLAVVDISDARVLDGDGTSARDRVEILLAADLLGVAQRAMELSVEHAKERQQFGRPIGAYQAVSHRCADMLVAVESARSTVLSAAWTADHDPDQLPFAASVAKVVAADAAWQVTTSSLQVHGGMGFTWEHPIHRYLRRAATSVRLFGTVEEHLDRLASLAGLALQPSTA